MTWPVLLAAFAATAAAVLVYYGHFGDVYREQFRRIAGEVWVAGAEISNPNSQTMASRLSYVPVLTRSTTGGPWWPSRQQAPGICTSVDRGTGYLGTGRRSHQLLRFPRLGVFTPVGMRYFLAGLPAVAIVVAATLVMAVRMPPAFRWATGSWPLGPWRTACADGWAGSRERGTRGHRVEGLRPSPIRRVDRLRDAHQSRPGSCPRSSARLPVRRGQRDGRVQRRVRIPNLVRDLFAEGAMTAAFVPTFTNASRAKVGRAPGRSVIK